jgi:hypothetical protein
VGGDSFTGDLVVVGYENAVEPVSTEDSRLEDPPQFGGLVFCQAFEEFAYRTRSV